MCRLKLGTYLTYSSAYTFGFTCCNCLCSLPFFYLHCYLVFLFHILNQIIYGFRVLYLYISAVVFWLQVEPSFFS